MERFKHMICEYECDDYILDTKTNKKYDENNFELLVRILNNLHQNKISFCIEQLEKAKGNVQHNILFVNCDDYVNVIEEIDNQITQLKEGK